MESCITPVPFSQNQSSLCKIDFGCLQFYHQLLSPSCLMGEHLKCWCEVFWRWVFSSLQLSLLHLVQGSSFSTPRATFSSVFSAVRTLSEARARQFSEHPKVFSVALSKISVKLDRLVCGIRAISAYLGGLYYFSFYLENLNLALYYYRSSLCL